MKDYQKRQGKSMVRTRCTIEMAYVPDYRLLLRNKISNPISFSIFRGWIIISCNSGPIIITIQMQMQQDLV